MHKVLKQNSYKTTSSQQGTSKSNSNSFKRIQLEKEFLLETECGITNYRIDKIKNTLIKNVKMGIVEKTKQLEKEILKKKFKNLKYKLKEKQTYRKMKKKEYTVWNMLVEVIPRRFKKKLSFLVVFQLFIGKNNSRVAKLKKKYLKRKSSKQKVKHLEGEENLEDTKKSVSPKANK
ncbi:18844_t:CDS:2 [Gigaspora margarita]|uniref:18844_t:CDS:1 n=1 Tax=Gigaspora margarita TaxID=4874 RepID=A0ABM8W2B7_GIGMA|nr:18844_t:CDS:2 [Gigaspora margarita]